MKYPLRVAIFLRLCMLLFRCLGDCLACAVNDRRGLRQELGRFLEQLGDTVSPGPAEYVEAMLGGNGHRNLILSLKNCIVDLAMHAITSPL